MSPWTSLWKKAASYLSRHGYEVYEISDQELNEALLGTSTLKTSWFNQKRYHVVADRELSAKNLDIWSSHPKVVESLWTDRKFSTKVFRNDWLVWAVGVAERDFITGDKHERVEGQSSTMDSRARS